jgi:hypothetical protein
MVNLKGPVVTGSGGLSNGGADEVQLEFQRAVFISGAITMTRPSAPKIKMRGIRIE